ncbi:CDGSH iron-sulfur domain-containing protein 2 homolog [Ctenocephalides felis]|uniref:CDGSH iron-sulfur domain-containing protein 2 homolog n=1 Tax=Ctenocephalides felis TaxID=7515 RepID=UPI000E6E365D|nr:CDGSH iron-sulfur domain-containing protein 2 homolog [Ctenocephalides felis]XP_026472643.1 CDGSH iron-sulfur domain-containing protein 2 homolog [Ctenocephalides felis]
MNCLSHLVKVTLPNYLSGLPIPDTFGGWFSLGIKDWISLVPPTAVCAGIGYMAYRAFCPHGRPHVTVHINKTINKDNPKVVDTIAIEDIAEKAVLCRCWKTKNWPYCDGSHGVHNKETGDNVGPVIVKKSA